MWLPAMVASLGCRGTSAFPSPVEPDRTGMRDVLVILLDDVGVDKISAYGEHPDAPLTPTIDQLAAEGVLFRNTWASSICSPSRAMLLTGRYTRRYGVGENLNAESDGALPDDEVLMPEILAPAGYTSRAFGKWHLMPAPGASTVVDGPLRHGFVSHAGSVGNLDSQTLDRHTGTDYFRWEKVTDGSRAFVEGYATTDLTDDAIAALRDTPEPWFAYLAYNAAHLPYHVPPDPLNFAGITEDDDRPSKVGAMVEAADAEIGRLLASLDPAVRARTTVFVLGDNGTEGAATTPPFDPDRAKVSLYEGGINVPMIVTGPDVAEPGSESAALVHVLDLFPSIAELAGVDTSGLVLDGESLLPLLHDPSEPGRDWLYTERLAAVGPPPWPNERSAIRDRRYKLLVLPERELLFDLQGRHDDGDDLLISEALEPDAQRALAVLRDRWQAVRAQAPYAYE